MDGEQTKVEGVTAEKAEAPQTKAITQAELDALISKAREDGEKSALEKYKGIQRTINKKDEEIRKLRANRPITETLNATLEEIKGLQNGEESQARNQRIAQLQANLTREQQLAKQEEVVQSEREKLNQKILEAGYDPSDEMFTDVDEAFEIAANLDGKFERAEKKLSRILGSIKKVEVKEEKKPVEDEAKLRERLEREILEKHGLLNPEKVAPSGKGKVSLADINNMSVKDLTKFQKEHGNRSILELIADGVVKEK